MAASITDRQSAPANQPWLAKFHELLREQLDSRLRPGFHGTLCLKLTIRDGMVEGIEDVGSTKHRIERAPKGA